MGLVGKPGDVGERGSRGGTPPEPCRPRRPLRVCPARSGPAGPLSAARADSGEEPVATPTGRGRGEVALTTLATGASAKVSSASGGGCWALRLDGARPLGPLGAVAPSGTPSDDTGWAPRGDRGEMSGDRGDDGASPPPPYVDAIASKSCGNGEQQQFFEKMNKHLVQRSPPADMRCTNRTSRRLVASGPYLHQPTAEFRTTRFSVCGGC